MVVDKLIFRGHTVKMEGILAVSSMSHFYHFYFFYFIIIFFIFLYLSIENATVRC